MAELCAEGPQPQQRWRHKLPNNQSVLLGREAGRWSVPWDRFLSREHAELTWRSGQLEVRKLPAARNPIFTRGQALGQFEIKPGEHFVIGETTFRLVEETDLSGPDRRPMLEERAIGSQELERIQFRDAPQRLDVLNRLPDVISRATDDGDLLVRLVNMLLAGIPRAEGIALVATDMTATAPAGMRVLHAERRRVNSGALQPSQRLVRDALKRQQTVLHVWGETTSAAVSTQQFTQAGSMDWAFCTPVRSDACKGWAIYVAGQVSSEASATLEGPWETHQLGDDLKFTELVAAILGSLRQVQLLQRKQTSLSQFFSPSVTRALADADPNEVLKPRETEVSVLFCDLRGFSRKSEQHGSNLPALLQTVSGALGLMTQNILDWGGVIGDFHGDAAMGFWGWPIDQPDAARRACLAALGIRTLFEAIGRWKDHPLAGFRVGVGLGTGRAVAGMIGSTDQVKITVFGPIVNLASRLEGMTKILRAPILLDERTAELARQQIPPQLGRLRRVARVKPYGLDTPLIVSELLPPAAEDPLLSDEHLAAYEAAYTSFQDGDWERTLELLHRVPPEDRVKDFLSMHVVKYDRRPPTGWKGFVEMESK
jgi:adenylate cyclase